MIQEANFQGIGDKGNIQMNILLIGSGGREHALAWKIAQSPMLGTLFCAPGNGGTGELGTSVVLDVSNPERVVTFCKEKEIGLVVVGPEAPLVAGLADDLDAADIPVFGPSKLAAQLEGSKGFTKDMCASAGIPTAAYARFKDADAAKAYVKREGVPIVVKADGLAAGKGVIIATTIDEACEALDDIFGGAFGDAGIEVVVEDFMSGEEASFFALSDGRSILPLIAAQDHKAVGEGDTGPNTGGMGAYSPAAVMDHAMTERVIREIIEPTAAYMRNNGMPFKGVFFAGLMITDDGPKLIEYNCRFGDPECQVLMMRMASDIVPLLLACANQTLHEQSVHWHEAAALTVVLAANGYPGSYKKGSEIRGIEKTTSIDGVQVFHAGTQLDGGTLKAVGGRVLNVTALADSVSNAQKAAYAAVDMIDWPEGFCRRDIGWRALEREKA